MEKLNPVAEGVVDIGLSPPLERLRVQDLAAFGAGAGQQGVEVIDQQGGVRLLRRAEVVLDAEVQLYRPGLEPAPATTRELGRLRDFGQAKDVAVEASGVALPAFRHRQLDVLEGEDGHLIATAGAPLSRPSVDRSSSS